MGRYGQCRGGEPERLSHLDRYLLSAYYVLGSFVGPGTSLVGLVRVSKKISGDCRVIKMKPVVVMQGLLARAVRQGFCEEGTSEPKPEE